MARTGTKIGSDFIQFGMGPAGPVGPKGDKGNAGINGTNGVNGTNGTNGLNGNISYDIGGFIVGRPLASAKVFGHIAVRGAQLPASLTGSKAKSETAATASTTFSLQKNGTNVGSFNFAAGATSATFSMTSALSIVAGDLLRIIAPSSRDATLADIYITFWGEVT